MGTFRGPPVFWKQFTDTLGARLYVTLALPCCKNKHTFLRATCQNLLGGSHNKPHQYPRPWPGFFLHSSWGVEGPITENSRLSRLLCIMFLVQLHGLRNLGRCPQWSLQAQDVWLSCHAKLDQCKACCLHISPTDHYCVFLFLGGGNSTAALFDLGFQNLQCATLATNKQRHSAPDDYPLFSPCANSRLHRFTKFLQGAITRVGTPLISAGGLRRIQSSKARGPASVLNVFNAYPMPGNPKQTSRAQLAVRNCSCFVC